MITQETKPKKSPITTIVLVFGVLLNVAALFYSNSGALVAVGCSLIAIGAASRRKAQAH